MTKIIGLTGGIGSGKTTVANLFLDAGIPVYIADEQAKAILDQPETVAQIAQTFGEHVIENGKVDRKKLASMVFNKPEDLAKLNAIIHPAVKQDFRTWAEKHSSKSFVIKEAAILFESGTNRDCDAVITVTAPLEVRIDRVMKRDGVTREEVLKRIDNQWDEAKKVALSDYVITNIEPEQTKRQFSKILKMLKNI